MNDQVNAAPGIFVLFLLSALIMLRQLVSPHFFSSFISDTHQYASWAWQFTEALKEGIIYPRWLPLNFMGYGSPTFIIYPPLAFYMVALFNVFSGSIVTAMNLTKFFSLFVSSVGIFLLARERYPQRVALSAGVINILLPFAVFSLYAGGAFTSSVSLIWFPFVLLFIDKYIKSGAYAHLLLAGACYGGLILTHLINAYMFTFVIVAFAAYISLVKKRPAHLIVIPVVIIIGIITSSAYFLPLLNEGRLISYKSVIENFPLSDLFVLPRHTDRLRADFFWPALYTEYVFHVIIFFVLTLLSLSRLLSSDYEPATENAMATDRFFFGTAFFSLFLLFGPSTFVWSVIPFFKYINIPVRWLNITSFAAVFLLASFFLTPRKHSLQKKWQYFLPIVIFLLFIFQDYKYIHTANVRTREELIPVKGIDWLPEHLPSGVNLAAMDVKGDSGGRAAVIKGSGESEVKAWKSAERIIEIKAGAPSTVRVRTFNFPGWTAYINEKRAEIKTEEGSGAILIDVPAGRHTLVLKFMDTPVRYYSKLISFISFAGIISVSFLKRRETMKR